MLTFCDHRIKRQNSGGGMSNVLGEGMRRQGPLCSPAGRVSWHSRPGKQARCAAPPQSALAALQPLQSLRGLHLFLYDRVSAGAALLTPSPLGSS